MVAGGGPRGGGASNGQEPARQDAGVGQRHGTTYGRSGSDSSGWLVTVPFNTRMSAGVAPSHRPFKAVLGAHLNGFPIQISGPGCINGSVPPSP
jgi:hypothetical protein